MSGVPGKDGRVRVLFLINQLFRGGAETALVNLLRTLDPGAFAVDLLIFDPLELPGGLSLVPEVPAWVRVVSTREHERHAALCQKAVLTLQSRITGTQSFRHWAVRYLQTHYYDAAISYGEWFSSALCARYAAARRKYVWVHADMDKAAFLHPDVVRLRGAFDGFLFVSHRSMEAAAARYPWLHGRSLVVPNRVERESVLAKSREPLPFPLPDDGLPVVVTAANVREEKNHIREVEAMRLLFAQGIRFHWFNVGSLANAALAARVRQAVREAGLTAYFHLPGALENPYPLLARADAVCVLSDHEAWSMVITEAKTLGVPVIATPTSGALEQIADGETGVLCPFSAEGIAGALRAFFTDPAPGARIRENLRREGMPGGTETALEALLLNRTKKTLFVFDDINYPSGARAAALAQARAAAGVSEVWLYSAVPCRDTALSQAFRFLSVSGGETLSLLAAPGRELLRRRDVSLRDKALRALHAALSQLGFGSALPEALLRRSMAAAFESFDTIFVVSEASRLRAFVARRKHPGKIQCIHTDYAAWRRHSAWTRAVTKHDGALYRRFDAINCLNKTLRASFLSVHPHLAGKTLAVPNPVCRAAIRERAAAPLPVPAAEGVFRLITIGRLETEKRCDALLEAAAALRERALPFHWYFVGDGPLRAALESQCAARRLEECVTFTGQLENPCPLLRACSALVLLSEYEGTPVAIDEAAALGVPVIAPDVGGVREQLESGGHGEIVENTAAGVVRAVLRAAGKSGIPRGA